MEINESKNVLDEQLKGVAGKPLSDLFGVMLSFYAQSRAETCKIEEDGDMLLFQWGIRKWGKQAEEFSMEIARQFILPKEDEPFQLHLTAYFPATPQLSAIKAGNEWCGSPRGLTVFQEFLASNKAYSLLKNEKPAHVETSFQQC